MAARGWSKLQDDGCRRRDKTQPGACSFLWENRRAPGLQVVPGWDLRFWCARGSVDAGSLACCSFPSPTAGSGSGWQRGQLLCVRGSGLSGGCRGGAVGFGAGWRAFGCMPSCRSEAGQRHPALLVREKELMECRSFSEASNGSVWRVKSGWSRGGAGQGLGAVSPQDSVSSWPGGRVCRKRDREITYALPSPPSPPYLLSFGGH